jgi:RNA polymerase sigma-70 factor (ECF subfamily)
MMEPPASACVGKTDQELATLTLRDQRYFLCLMRRYEERLMRYVRRISGVRRDEAEDILQEVFIKVYRNLNEFDTDLAFSSWIYRITHNETVSYWRRTKARPHELLSLEDSEEALGALRADVDEEHAMDVKYTAAQVRAVLSRLDLKYREALTLRFLEEKSYSEISDILRKPPGTVATLLSRAKQAFREEANRRRILFS